MHFGLTEEQVLLQETLRHFISKELPAPRQRALFDAGQGWDAALWQQSVSVGLPGLVIPEELGGSGLEMLELALAFEVLGEGAVPGPFLGHALATLAISHFGTAEQRERWLPDCASGSRLASVALGEGDAGWDSSEWQIAAGSGRISGTKRFVEVTPETDLLVVGVKGGGLGLVDVRAGGVRIEAIDPLDRARPIAHVVFEDAAIEALEGGAEAGGRLVDAACTLLAADAFGAAWRLVRMTAEYALAREQFGTVIAQFQAVKHQLANMAMEAEPMRGLVWYAAYAFDHRRDESARDAALAKAHITDHAVRIGREAVSLHGGIGFTWECDVQFWVKRTLFDRAWLGSPQSHRERAARLGGW